MQECTEKTGIPPRPASVGPTRTRGFGLAQCPVPLGRAGFSLWQRRRRALCLYEALGGEEVALFGEWRRGQTDYVRKLVFIDVQKQRIWRRLATRAMCTRAPPQRRREGGLVRQVQEVVLRDARLCARVGGRGYLQDGGGRLFVGEVCARRVR